MHDNISKLFREFFLHKRFRENTMEWLPSNPDVNSIKNLWSIVNIKLYERSKQYNREVDKKSN